MDSLKKVSTVLKALSDENRLRIAIMLLERPICVCEINEILHIALSTISAHLKTLKFAGIITDVKDKRWVEYRLTDDKEIRELLTSIKNNLSNCQIILQDIEKLSKIDRYTCSNR
ncbi:MAG: ArsR/SmtB family transcription factor [Calditerrivibrio sp.]|uniref:ArsR/SmtB family transcription factor n=1 Tax=Calditerrivibrio sp. TaxID=2792612 RepID=UPI003D12A7AB